MEETDRQKLNNLITAVGNGHIECLDAIYSIAAKRMYAAALVILRNKASAEDAVSDAFVKIVKSASSYLRADEPMGWLLRIVKNVCLDKLRKDKRRAEISAEEFYSLADDSYSPEKRETAITLEHAMQKLPPEERRVIRMRYYLDMTVREICKATGMSKSAAERLIQKSENNLKILLSDGKNETL